jgi:hypothetical protein
MLNDDMRVIVKEINIASAVLSVLDEVEDSDIKNMLKKLI